MIRPLQVSTFPRVGSQQASTVAMQSTVIPTDTSTTTGLDMSSLMNLMITMMIVVMMMKMMTGAMGSLGGSNNP